MHSDLGVDPSALEVLPKLIDGPGDVVLAVAPGHDEQRRPGDTLRVESEILEILPSRSKPNQAIVKVRSTTLNQHGEPVHSFTSKCLVFKRPQA